MSYSILFYYFVLYLLFRKMLDDNTFDLVDKFYGEFHPGQPHGVNRAFRDKISSDLGARGKEVLRSKDMHLVSWSSFWKVTVRFVDKKNEGLNADKTIESDFTKYSFLESIYPNLFPEWEISAQLSIGKKFFMMSMKIEIFRFLTYFIGFSKKKSLL